MKTDLTVILIVAMMFLAALYGGAETGIYQMSRLRLRLGIENRRWSYIMLGKIMDDSAGLLISILIGSNLAFYVITSIVTHILFDKVGNVHTAELLVTVLMAPVLFIFCDLIPKNLFFYRADGLVPYVSGILYVSKKVFTWTGAVFLLKRLARFLAGLTGSAVTGKSEFVSLSWPYVKAIYHETHEEGILSTVQSDIIGRLEVLSRLNIRAVMTPLNMVQMVDIEADREHLLDILRTSAFTRLPVFKGQQANIIGYIDIYEVLNSGRPFNGLSDFLRPVKTLSAFTILNEAIEFMQQEKEKIVLVTRTSSLQKEKPVGIVTMKDLAEELMGELMEW